MVNGTTLLSDVDAFVAEPWEQNTAVLFPIWASQGEHAYTAFRLLHNHKCPGGQF